MKKIFLISIFGFMSLFAFDHLNPNNIDEKLKNKNAIVDFYAVWCPPCKILAKKLIEFDKIKPSDVVIYKVDIDQHMELAKRYNVQSLPTLVYFKDGKMITKEVGIKDENELIANSKKYFR